MIYENTSNDLSLAGSTNFFAEKHDEDFQSPSGLCEQSIKTSFNPAEQDLYEKKIVSKRSDNICIKISVATEKRKHENYIANRGLNKIDSFGDR